MLLELRTLMLCLVQLSKWREQGHGCWKGSFSVRESAKCNFKSTAQVHEDVSFMKWNVIAMQKTDFHVLELFAEQVI